MASGRPSAGHNLFCGELGVDRLDAGTIAGAMTITKITVVLLLLAGCPPTPTGTIVGVSNQAAAAATVNVSFGADSAVKASDWSSFCAGSGLVCSFPLAASATQPLPTSGKYLNATLAFNGSGCGATKAEINVNNPKWYDTLDVSLVDGYSNNVTIIATPTIGSPTQLGPPLGKDGNEMVFGLFPYGCDICTARQAPPCGIAPGGTGCKAGTQYKPDVPCQWQGPNKGGGGLTVDVQLLP